MHKNRLKGKLRNGKVVFGSYVYSGSPAVVELMGYVGLDFVVFDYEHGPFSLDSLESLIRTADGVGLTPIVKLPDNDPVKILQVLDRGVMGIHVSHVETKQDAIEVVKAAKYFPLGERGIATTPRSAQYGYQNKDEYIKMSNEETMLILVIESITGIDNLSEILSVEGIDQINIGVFDLSQSLGIPGQFDHPKEREAIDRAVKIGKEKGVPLGIVPHGLKMAQEVIEKGFQYIMYGTDMTYLTGALKESLTHLKGFVKG
jgi:4-hydroxy-2-oxoheptanedioate aldolase